LGEGLAGQAALERRLIHVPDLTNLEGGASPAQHLKQEGFQSYIGVPLPAKGQVQGVLEIFHRSPLEPDGEWLDFMKRWRVRRHSVG
jgi:GAF domain-containing protein